MNPWQWSWAPEIHLPLSGAVAQQIEPNTNWFFGAIAPSAGSARIEKRAFDIASYGRQLGLINRVLIALAEQPGTLPAAAAEPLARLKAIQDRIDQIKVEESQATADQIERQIQDLKTRNATEFAALAARLRPLLGEGGG